MLDDRTSDGGLRFSAEFDRFAARGAAAAIQQQEVVSEYLGGGIGGGGGGGGDDGGSANESVFELDAGTLSVNGRTLSGVTCLGTFSELDDSWLWLWDDPRVGWEHPAAAPLRTVYRVGDQLGIPEFSIGGFPLAEFPDPRRAAATLAVAAGRLLGGRGVWGCPAEDGKGTAFLHLGDESVPLARFDPSFAPHLLRRAVAAFPADPRAVVLGFGEHHRLKIDLAPRQVVLRGDLGDVTIEFDETGRIVDVGSGPAAR